MSVANPYFLSQHVGSIISDVQYRENLRREYDIHDVIYGLYPEISSFCQFQMSLNRAPTTDKLMVWQEEREQSARQLFKVKAAVAADVVDDSFTGRGRASGNDITLTVACRTDKYGRLLGSDQIPIFLEAKKTILFTGQTRLTSAADSTYKNVPVIAQILDNGVTRRTSNSDAQINVQILSIDGYKPTDTTYFPTSGATKTFRVQANAQGFMLASNWAEATRAPDGHRDFIYANEAYLQIFKEAVPLMSGTQLAMKNRGYMHEWDRTWRNAMYRFKLQMANAFLFNTGYYNEETFGGTLQSGETSDPGNADRATWGIIPYVTRYGFTADLNYQSTYYDHFVDLLETYLDPAKGMADTNVVLYCSRKIANWFSKIGQNNFYANSLSSAGPDTRVNDAATLTGQRGPFGFWMNTLNTRWGNVTIVADNLIRGPYEDVAFMTTMEHTAYRFLPGREAKVMSSVQDNDIDGRKDMILGEVGLQVRMPEMHMVLEFNNAAGGLSGLDRWDYSRVAA